MPLMPPELACLPLAQTIWYMPTGLDPWNQLLGKMPGHYMRLYEHQVRGQAAPARGALAGPGARSPIEGTCRERLNTWLTLVQRGEVINSYRVFLGLLGRGGADEAKRTALLAQLVFAGLIDVQDRMLHNRSYTTGHKSYRARATIELARRGRLGARALRPVRGRARHRGGAALVLDLRDGLPRRSRTCSTAATASCSRTTCR